MLCLKSSDPSRFEIAQASASEKLNGVLETFTPTLSRWTCSRFSESEFAFLLLTVGEGWDEGKLFVAICR